MSGCLLRLYWMILGNALLALALISIFRNTEGFLSVADIVFVCAVAALLAARWVDIVKLNGLTASGDPATPGHLKRYIVVLVVASAVLWGLAHGASQMLR
jgi:hypothetical protein